MSTELFAVVTILAVAGGLVLVGGLIVRLRRGSRDAPVARRTSPAIREREAAISAQLAVEEHDIDEMLEAQDGLRRRIGEQSIGEELLDQALDPRYDDPA